jgi:hypothetical protein
MPSTKKVAARQGDHDSNSIINFDDNTKTAAADQTETALAAALRAALARKAVVR